MLSDSDNLAWNTTFEGEDEDLFGFGEFTTVFISDLEIASAKEKLDEETSQSDRVSSLWASLSDCTSYCESSSGLSCILCLQWTQLGSGMVAVNDETLFWKGSFILDSRVTTLGFELKDCSKASTKTLDACHALLITFKDTQFVQFLFESAELAQSLKESLDLYSRPIASIASIASQMESESDVKAKNELEIAIQAAQDELELTIQQARLEMELKVQEARLEMERKVAHATSLYALNENEKECQICYNDTVSLRTFFKRIGLLPCCHELCSACHDKIVGMNDTLNCPFDRLAVSFIDQLHLP